MGQADIGSSQAAISERDPGEEGGGVAVVLLLCWMVDAAGLSRCTWEWEGVVRGGGLCYETEDGLREALHTSESARMQATAWQEAVIRLGRRG